MSVRKEKFKEGLFYHVFNRTIANFKVFKDLKNAKRFVQTLGYYNNEERKINLSLFLIKNPCFYPDLITPQNNQLIKFISFCIMPDHYHLLIKILKNNVLSKYISDVENSFSRYFNIKFNRQGPIWQGRFKTVRIKNNNQLLHVSRYIHLNPTTAGLVKKPEEWIFSSYLDFIKNEKTLSCYIKEISISSSQIYKKFVDDQIDYQKKLDLIKKLKID